MPCPVCVCTECSCDCATCDRTRELVELGFIRPCQCDGCRYTRGTDEERTSITVAVLRRGFEFGAMRRLKTEPGVDVSVDLEDLDRALVRRG